MLGHSPTPLVEHLGDAPLCSQPLADEATYRALFEEARKQRFPEIDRFEQDCGSAVPRDWLDELALHTQIVVKTSKLNYQHGRVLYAALRRRLADFGEATRTPRVFETGTARGFSALCMARALRDAGRTGSIVTVDILPHDRPIYWNCIDDLTGKKTRRELLAPWRELSDDVLFVQSDTASALERVGLERVDFAFLDASHTYEDVMREFAFVESRQRTGDVVVFDDVSPGQFPGVVQAVEEIAACYPYDVERLSSDSARGYAVATRAKE